MGCQGGPSPTRLRFSMLVVKRDSPNPLGALVSKPRTAFFVGCGKQWYTQIRNCAFYAGIKDFMVSCFGEWRVQGRIGRWIHFLVTHSISTVSTGPRLVLWAARKGQWAIRCMALLSAPLDFDVLVTKWLGEIRGLLLWNSLIAFRPSSAKFFPSHLHCNHEGPFPLST